MSEDSEATTRKAANIIGSGTAVNISLVVLLSGALVKGALYKADVDHQLDNLRSDVERHAGIVAGFDTAVKELQRLTDSIRHAPPAPVTHGDWKRYSMNEWERQLQADNPTLKVPDAMKTPWFDNAKGVIIYP